MRRTHLRHHDNIIKRLLIHGCAFNLGLAMRKMTGYGTPRGLHERLSLMNLLVSSLRLLWIVITLSVTAGMMLSGRGWGGFGPGRADWFWKAGIGLTSEA